MLLNNFFSKQELETLKGKIKNSLDKEIVIFAIVNKFKLTEKEREELIRALNNITGG